MVFVEASQHSKDSRGKSISAVLHSPDFNSTRANREVFAAALPCQRDYADRPAQSPRPRDCQCSSLPPSPFRRNTRVSEFESGVTQSVAKRIKRFTCEIAVCASLHVIVVERRQLAVILIKSYRQLSTGIIIAKQDIGYGVSSLLSRIPCLKDCVAR